MASPVVTKRLDVLDGKWSTIQVIVKRTKPMWVTRLWSKPAFSLHFDFGGGRMVSCSSKEKRSLILPSVGSRIPLADGRACLLLFPTHLELKNSSFEVNQRLDMFPAVQSPHNCYAAMDPGAQACLIVRSLKQTQTLFDIHWCKNHIDEFVMMELVQLVFDQQAS